MKARYAWNHAAKLIKLCLGFENSQQVVLRKLMQKYDDKKGQHVISLVLYVQQKPLVKHKPIEKPKRRIPQPENTKSDKKSKKKKVKEEFEIVMFDCDELELMQEINQLIIDD